MFIELKSLNEEFHTVSASESICIYLESDHEKQHLVYKVQERQVLRKYHYLVNRITSMQKEKVVQTTCSTAIRFCMECALLLRTTSC